MMGRRWEVFGRDGHALYTTRFRFMARVISRRTHLDYERVGEGWLR